MTYEPHPDHPLEIACPCFPEEERRILHENLERILTGKLSMGPFTEQFEHAFAASVGAAHGIAFPSCTAALEAALLALGLQPGDEVLVPAQTFVATPAAVTLAGGKPVFTEVEGRTFSMDFDDALARLTPRTRGAIVVHFGGMISPGLPAFHAEMRRRGLFVIEDAAHTPGAELHGRLAGNLSDAGCFSFYPTKVITTGEGGFLSTSDPALAARARSLQNRGRDMASRVELYTGIGRNNRFTEVSAAMGLSQLRLLPSFLEARRAVARIYDEALSREAAAGLPLRPMLAPEGSRPNYWRHCAFLAADISRAELRTLLAQDRITIDWAYDPPAHLQPAFQSAYGNRPGMLPQSEALMQRHICLPVHARMRTIDAEYVARQVATRVRQLAAR